MKSTKIPEKVQKQLNRLLADYPRVGSIVHKINEAGGTTYLVGGAVRDLLLGLPVKDLDCEVHNLSLQQLQDILETSGPVSLVGKAYGVMRLHGLDVDWSLPRTDASGRKPEVVIDPSMSVADAFARRDLTINAMGINLVTNELVDPFGGYDDLVHKVLRAPDAKKFIEDPLRFFRVFQFVGRFGMKPDDQLNALCRSMDISSVSKERISQEFTKWLLRSPKPSRALDWLRSIGRLDDVLPEVAATIGVEQGKQYHPEGDVYEHTKQALDAAAQLAYDNDEQKLILLYAALCHDIGKVTHSKRIGDRITSHGHAQAGAQLARTMLKRITNNKKIIDNVATLVNVHMDPLGLIKGNAGPAAYKRLAHKLAPDITIALLGKLLLADRRGRNPARGEPLTTTDDDVLQFLARAQEVGALDAVEEPVLLGKDLLDVVEPGPALGRLVKRAYEIQIDEGITDKQELRRRVLKNGKKR